MQLLFVRRYKSKENHSCFSLGHTEGGGGQQIKKKSQSKTVYLRAGRRGLNRSEELWVIMGNGRGRPADRQANPSWTDSREMCQSLPAPGPAAPPHR